MQSTENNINKYVFTNYYIYTATSYIAY